MKLGMPLNTIGMMLSLLQPPTWLLHVMVYEAVSKGLTYSSHQSIECSRKSLLTQQRTAFILLFFGYVWG